jgi:hypothetical protein
MAAGYAFAFIVAIGAGIWTPPEHMWFPTLATCEAARQGAEEMGATTTDCERASLSVEREGAVTAGTLTIPQSSDPGRGR